MSSKHLNLKCKQTIFFFFLINKAPIKTADADQSDFQNLGSPLDFNVVLETYPKVVTGREARNHFNDLKTKSSIS